MSAPRFPSVPAHKGHYESYYLRAADPAGGRSAWIRHTVFKRPGGPPTGALWCTLFEAGPRAARGQAVAPRPARPATGWRSATATSARTARAGGPRRWAEPRGWDLTFGPSSAPLRHLPARLYRRRSRARSSRARCPTRRSPAASSDWELDGWPRHGRPQLGRRARRALDLAARVVFDGAPDAWLDVALGPGQGRARADAVDRQRRAAASTASAGGVRGLARVDESAHGGTIEVGGLRIEVAAPQVVSWIYADPSGGEHRSTNCSIARRRAHRRTAARCAPSTAAPGSSARARRRPASRRSPTRTRSGRAVERRRPHVLVSHAMTGCPRATRREMREPASPRDPSPAGSERPTISCLRRSSSIRGWSRG